MKIAFVAQPIDPVLPPKQNSIGIWTYEVGRRLSRNHEILVYCSDKAFHGKKRVLIDGAKFNAVSMRLDNKLLRYLKQFSRHFKPKRPLFASKLYYLGYIIKIALSLRTQQCDIVHIHNFSQFVPIVRALNPDINIVLHMHCEWLTQLDHNMIESRLKNVDIIISCSEYITQKTRRSFPKFALRCHTVSNGIDANNFFHENIREIRKTDDDHKNILFVGRISPEKGIHILLDAFEKVLDHCPNSHLQLVGPQTPAPEEYIVALSDDPKVSDLARFYSKYDGGYLSHLEKHISQNLGKCVTFFKYVPYTDLSNFYNTAKVFVFPSIWNEPFGMPIIEAMASGLPVVATNGGGIPEIVEHGKTGLLVERGSSEKLAKAILSLIENEELRKSMGNAGRRRAIQSFTWEKIFKTLEDQYNKLFLNRNIFFGSYL